MRLFHLLGPPDTPLLTVSSFMTEGVRTSLSCTADMGYPDDWRLDWSVASLPVYVPTSPSSSGQRYSFTSNLEFTPSRQNNGQTIKCTARKDGWTGLEPESSSVLNVQCKLYTYPPQESNRVHITSACFKIHGFKNKQSCL